MASTTMATRAALFLVALFHASSSWDASNIWFPDTNNPVFYNMTFYQQAAQTVDNMDNHIPATEPPRFEDDRKRPRPAVFNRLPDTRAPVGPTEAPSQRFTTPTPNIVQRGGKKPNRNRPPPKTATSNGRFQGDAAQSDLSKLIAEQQAFIRNEQNSQRFRNPGEGVTVSRPQSGNRRYSADQHNMFVRNEQRPDFYPEVPVGYKTVPLEETTSARTQTYSNEGARQQLSGNRLGRTKSEGIADGDNYFNRDNNGGRFSGQQRWNGNRDSVLRQSRPEERRVETTSNGIANERSFARPVERAVDPAEENRRRWNNYAGITAGTRRVEENVIADREETSSNRAGPSKCVWAIISCCKPSSPEIRYTCFETLGCHGAFWDTNPCSKEMTMAAVQATANFYNIPRTVE